jgi:NADPH:quinone reductase-like Zn-dependent oxidoreductase
MAYMPNFMAQRPFIAEGDLAGTIVSSRDTEHPVGTRVVGFIPVDLQSKIKQGALAEFVCVPTTHIAHISDRISSLDIAGLPLAGETAYQGLIEHGGLQEGQTIFINGGSSSVGAYAIQIAKAKGCTVWASASGKNEEYVRGLGTDVVSYL